MFIASTALQQIIKKAATFLNKHWAQAKEPLIF